MYQQFAEDILEVSTEGVWELDSHGQSQVVYRAFLLALRGPERTSP